MTPHTQRLLKLIEEGTKEHAELASQKLAAISAESSNPVVLWDLLGRLQFFLMSRNWQTRYNASAAMEAVAFHLPAADQLQFLECKLDQTTSAHCWLSVDDLQHEMLDKVIDNGRLLLASSISAYDQLEEEEVDRLDENAESFQDFCERRMHLQRTILVKRLGLAGVLHSTTPQKSDVLKIISTEDLMPWPKKRKLDNIDAAGSADADSSLRALLVLEMKRQTTENASQSKPQTLLATDLIFRMFSPHWHERHGAILGVRALLRAWKVNHSSSNFGKWQQDILARCLCVLALDRFGDFSGAAISDTTGTIVAPVREIAGQVLSAMLKAAPVHVQEKTVLVLIRLASRHDWEVRHGSLIALRYIFVMVHGWLLSNQAIYNKLVETVAACLSDEADDVQGVAAQCLSQLQSLGRLQSVSTHKYIQPLWLAIYKMNPLSTCMLDLLNLFSEAIGNASTADIKFIDPSSSLSEISRSITGHLTKLFLETNLSAVQRTAIKALSKLVRPLISSLNVNDGDDSTHHKETTQILLAVSDVLRVTLERIAHLECSTIEAADEKVGSKSHNAELRNSWIELSTNISMFLSNFRNVQEQLDQSLLLAVNRWGRKFDNCMEIHQQRQVDSMDSAAEMVVRHLLNACGEDIQRSRSDVLIFFLRVSLHSPVASECAVACFLYRWVLKLSFATEDVRQRMSEIVQPHLHQFLCDGAPSLMLLEAVTTYSSVISDRKNDFVRVFEASFQRVVDGEADALAESRSVIIALQQFGKDAQNEKHVSPRLVPRVSMRLKCIFAGSIVAGGSAHLPKKLTSLMRALMTSIKNEQDASFQGMTSSFVSDLLITLYCSDNVKSLDVYAKSRHKIFTSICNLVGSTVEHQHTTSTKILKLVIKGIPVEFELSRIEPLCAQLDHLNSQEKESAAMLTAFRLLGIIFEAAPIDSRAFVHICSSTYTKRLIDVGCTSGSENIRKVALTSIQEICSKNAFAAFEHVLSSIYPFLDEHSALEGYVRLRACHMLRAAILSSGMSMRPLIRQLLPRSMKLMTDPDPECGKIGASIFGVVVRVAPLAQETCKTDNGGSGHIDIDHRESVVDHLIHGKSLPACTLPAPVQVALSKNAITLRPYQAEGVAWLQFLQSASLNGVLCDSMGLGKTLQALIAVAIAHHNQSDQGAPARSIVVCPSTVVGHWINEIKRFFPGKEVFRAVSVVGSVQNRESYWSANSSQWNIAVTSYAVLRSDIAHMSPHLWQYCVLDEGHLLRNPKTATSVASRKIRARHKLILSGTPVQNKVSDLWACFDFLMPNFLGSHKEFRKEFSSPITRSQLSTASAEDVWCGMDKLKILHQQVLPFILRREKGEVLKDLPPKTITVIECEMTAIQQKLYKLVCEGSDIKKSMYAVALSLQNADESGEIDIRQLGAATLKALTFLRLVCTHPCLLRRKDYADEDMAGIFSRRESSGKLMVLRELLLNAGVLHDIMGADNDASCLYCPSDDEDNDPDEVEAVLKPQAESVIADEGRDGSKCLIFAQFTFSLDVVEELLIGKGLFGTRYLRLDGRVPPEKRQGIVESFNNDSNIRILLLTTKIGGLGLNLTGADTVIFMEQDWNPHNDLQAMDRAHRIGQTRPVNVYNIITKNSIEEIIIKIQRKKLQMSEAIVNSENSSMYSMGTDRLLDIFTFRGTEHGSNDSNDDNNCNDNLDVVFKQYMEDYATLSMDDFKRGFDLN